MEKLIVSPNAYYDEQWTNNGYKITKLTDFSFLVWHNGHVIKCADTLEHAERHTNNLPLIPA